MMKVITHLIIKTTHITNKMKIINSTIKDKKHYRIKIHKFTAFNKNSKLILMKNLKTNLSPTWKEKKNIFESEHNIIKILPKVPIMLQKYQKESNINQKKIQNNL